jgi:hypothetical protein
VIPCATLKMEAARSCEMSVTANRHDVLDQNTSNVYKVVLMFVMLDVRDFEVLSLI